MPENTGDESGAAVETLLRGAPPRISPPAEDERLVRQAVQTEWQSVVRQRKSRSSRWVTAVAASIIASVVLVQYSSWQSTSSIAIDLAGVDKRRGSVNLVVNGSGKQRFVANTIQSGQLVETGPDSALGLAWSTGGSLRLDQDTLLEFIDQQTVFLHRGRVYFDSLGIADGAQLVVDTTLGTVTHNGTQFMTSAGNRELVVSVREGSVKIDGRYFDETANQGKQVQMRGSMRPVIVDLAPHSSSWAWTEALSPGIDLNNRSVLEFLQWVSRETGYELVFDSAMAENHAAGNFLVGMVEADPRTELRLRLLTTDLDYSISAAGGTITVRLAEQGQP